MKVPFLKVILLQSMFWFSICSFSQENSIQNTIRIATKTEGFFEGFARNTGINEFTYQSLRDDVTSCLLTRCTDGNMAIEWQTAVVEENDLKEGAGFVWLAALDHTTQGKRFSVYINDRKCFTFLSSAQPDREFDGEGGAKMGFNTVSNDQHSDFHGYMWVWLPKEWIIQGKSQTIRIVGEAAGSSSWMIVYQATDAVAFLRNSARYSTWAELIAEPEKSRYNITLICPPSKAGEKISIQSGTRLYSSSLELTDSLSKARFSLPKSALGTSITIKDETGKIVTQEFFGNPETSTILIPKSLLDIECIEKEGRIEIKTMRTYKPATIESISRLAQNTRAGDKILLMNSSHQDIAWMDSPENCVILRDTMLLTPLFEIGSQDPHYRFDVEDALMIKEYTTRHPDKRNLVQQMLNNGNISCGASYTQPYEELLSGEALARQFYMGKRWLLTEFVYKSDTYWNVDVPGRTLQMPQIMLKAGVKNLMLSRQEKGLYHWYSPDGSRITVYSPGHYGDAYVQLNKTFYDAARFMAQDALHFNNYFTEKALNRYTPVLSDWDMSAAKDYSKIIAQWSSIDKLEVDESTVIQKKLPEIKLVTAPEFFAAVEKEKTLLPTIHGERPALWLYIHGPTHYEAITASREADILLTMAEKFATVNALAAGSYNKYPYERLNKAWEAKIFPDHGWGGKNGQITDELFKEKYKFARNEARSVLDLALNQLASHIQTQTEKGIAVVVFNSLNWTRSDYITVDIQYLNLEHPIVTDENGKEYEAYRSGNVLTIFAENIPSIGYKTLYINGQKKNQSTSTTAPKINIDPLVTENKFYKITFTNGGIQSIVDKELDKELLDTQKFKGGEVFTMRSEGTGAGEFSDIQPPTMDGFDKTSLHAGEWKLREKNILYTSYSFRCEVRSAEIEEIVTIYENVKRIDFDVALLNWTGEIYREFRMALPLNLVSAKVSYEVPFGVVNVGDDEMAGTPGERHKTLCSDIHPRGIQNWISASDTETGVTLSSCVAVADWIDPTSEPVQTTILQPLLLAARRSCHEEGNEYLQTGDHRFSFSLTSHVPGWQNGYKTALGFNEKLQVVSNPIRYENAKLPAELSFFTLNKPNLLISTIKMAEDQNGFIARIYEIEGKETNAKLTASSPLNECWRTDLLEYKTFKIPSSENEVEISAGKFSIETYFFGK